MPEARFCRQCGAPLKAIQSDGEPVSPQAQTVPLTSEARPTTSIAEEAGRTETSRVKQVEIEEMLRRVRAEHDFEAKEPAPTTAASAPAVQTSMLPAQDKPASALQSQTPARARKGNAWPLLILGLFSIALFAGLVYFLAHRSSTATGVSNANANGEGASTDAFLSEAKASLSSGDVSGAITKLREAVRRDPQNAQAHFLLGQALERNNQRLEAIEQYRAATGIDAKDAASWRALASAQFAEGIYSDAIESYRGFIGVSGEDSLDDNARLEYANALRLSGHTDEARALYQKLAASDSQDLANIARKHLSELGAAQSPQPTPTRDVRQQNLNQNRAIETNSNVAATPQPTPAAPPTPQPTVPPTPQPTPNAPSKSDADSYFAQAAAIVSGRDIKKIPDAELIRALEFFQRAAQGGTHRAEAQREANRLGAEFDRRGIGRRKRG